MAVKDYNLVLPVNIVRIINEKGMKQCVIAKRAGFSNQQFSDMLNGRKIIKPCDALVIAEALGVTIFSAQITGSDMLCWIPKTVIIGEETPNAGDYLLTKNGYLFNVLNVVADGMSVRRVSNIGSPVGAKVSRFFFTSETADYTWDRLSYGKLFPNEVTPNASDAILCTNGALFEISSFASSDPTSDPIVNYIANIGTKGVETRGFSIFYCGSESQGHDTEYVYAYHVTGGSALQNGDLILTRNGMLYIVDSVDGYYVYVTYIQTLYA